MKIKTLIILLLFPVIILCQEKGRLIGTITDTKTGEPLIGVNIIIRGTYYGAAAGLNGEYIIDNINPGVYDIEATMIGYKVVLQTAVNIPSNIPTRLNFLMEETVLTVGEEVVVIGEKPLFDANETSSMSRINSDDILNKSVSSVEDILSEQVGVTKQDNEIHIRGGRIDESMFVVDGLSIKDPLSGYSGNLFVNPDAIEELEIITGGYNAEYGQAMSGVVNIKLKRGMDKYEGTFKYMSDHFGASPNVLDQGNSDRIEFTFGGPALLDKLIKITKINIPGSFSVFLNGYGKFFDSHLPTAIKLHPHRNWAPLPGMSQRSADQIMSGLAPRENNDWHFLYKLSWDIATKKKLAISYDISLNINQGYFMSRAFSSTYYPYAYEPILDNYNTITRESRLLNINWTHTLNTRSFYEITFGRFLTLEHSSVKDLHWTEYEERLDLDPIHYIIYDDDGNTRITFGDEFYDTGSAPEWYDLVSDNYRLDMDWTLHTETRHKLKTGFENTVSNIQVLDIDEPWNGTSGLGSNYDMYTASNLFGAFYIQDQITFEGMTANIGLRYDYWFPGKYVENAINDPNSVIITDVARKKFYDETFELFNYRGKGRLSPRIGISHPVTDNDVLYFYYGHFSQLPTFQYVYAKLNSNAQSTYQIFGNPNLNPKTTVQYELGVKHRFNPDQVIEVKAYWKDMFDYETSQTITPSNPKYSHLKFNMYFNADYARSRGIEVILKSRLFANWYADMNLNYSIVTGKSASALDNLLVQAGELDEKPLGENFMPWDKPLQFFSNLYYNSPSGWGVSTRFEFSSNRRYTRAVPGTEEYPDGLIEVNGENYYIGTYENDKPFYYFSDYSPKLFKLFGLDNIKGHSLVDVKLYKTFTYNQKKLKLFVEFENIFDEMIPRRINPYTGQGYNPGEIIPYSMINSPNPNKDPSRNSRPFSAEFGMQVYF